MNGPRRLMTTLLPAAVLLTSATQAMEIQQFDQMSLQDQTEYINLIVEGAQKVLIEQGQKDLAAKVHKLFTEVIPGDHVSIGLAEFEVNLDRARVLDLQRVIKDAGVTRVEVEHAMAATLQKNQIKLPPAFMHVADNFKPKLPLR